MSAATSTRPSSPPPTTRSSSRSARASSATSRPPGASSTASTSRWTTSTSATAASPATAAARRREPEPGKEIIAEGKHVVVIGGGDTGMDCISNANREGALSATLLDVYPEVPVERPLPRHALAAAAEALVHHLRARRGRRAPLRPPGHRPRGRRQGRDAGRPPRDRHLVAHARAGRRQRVRDARRARADRHRLPAPRARRRRRGLGLELDQRGNVAAQAFTTSREGVFAAGDARVGQSLIVTAIAEGRRCARAIDRRLRERGLLTPGRTDRG